MTDRVTITRRLGKLAPLALIAAVVAIWLAPITLLGKMPIGGDVTSFFLPLMSYYRRALMEGRVPLWNELWGFGFPMLAESQAGVFYPPHLVLFRLFEVETAYSLNIVLHHVLAGWFAYFCGREFGLRRWGATLAGLVFAGNGFFIIHFPHQWSYTTGCWMPLAVGLAWRVLRKDEGGRMKDKLERTASVRSRLRPALLLALVLTVQMLAGHFQIAFYTQVVIALMALLASGQFFTRWLASRRATDRGRRAAGPRPATGSLAVAWLLAPVAAAFLLSAVQILPTYELIQVALPEGRDFEYLSGFANTPFHLVSYVLPTLFHVNPLWRPVAWDPFHTSPEECFSYVGLLPLCLAGGAAWRWRRDPRVRLWVVLAAVTLLLSMGPYVPGFKLLIRLPGFDGFRSASRWGVGTALFLGLLAGRALHGLRDRRRLMRWMVWFTVAWLGSAAAWGGSTHVLLRSRVSSDTPALKLLRGLSPWPKEFDARIWDKRINEPARGLERLRGLADLGYDLHAKPGDQLVRADEGLAVRQVTLAGERGNIWRQEFTAPALCLVMVWLCVLCSRRRIGVWPMVMVVAADLGAASWLRPTDYVPRCALVEQSPVLSFLSTNAAGRRVMLAMGNLPMLARTAELSSYRTVDIPMTPRGYGQHYGLALSGVHRLSFEAVRARQIRSDPQSEVVSLVDPVLGRIRYGRSLLAFAPELAEFPLYLHGGPRSHAQFLPLHDLMAVSFAPGTIASPESELPPGSPLMPSASGPEHEQFQVRANVPGVVRIMSLHFPGWEGTLRSGAVTRSVPIVRSLGGSCEVRIPDAGDYELALRYRSWPFELGWKISVAAMATWCVAFAVVSWLGRHGRSTQRA
jgi:hypothetical protein